MFGRIVIGKNFEKFLASISGLGICEDDKEEGENYCERKIIFGAVGNTLNNHQMMGSLRMFGAGGLLLIFLALGTNGQLLTEKIPLGKVFALYVNW